MTDPVQELPATDQQHQEFWRAPWEFTVHAVVGTIIFAIIAAAAVLLGFAVDKLANFGTAVAIVYGLRVAEYALFGNDLILYLVFLWRTSKRIIPTL